MEAICCGVGQTYGGEVTLNYECQFVGFVHLVKRIMLHLCSDGYPPTINAYPECVARVSSAAAKVKQECKSS